jgi:hypothetical protein
LLNAIFAKVSALSFLQLGKKMLFVERERQVGAWHHVGQRTGRRPVM